GRFEFVERPRNLFGHEVDVIRERVRVDSRFEVAVERHPQVLGVATHSGLICGKSLDFHFVSVVVPPTCVWWLFGSESLGYRRLIRRLFDVRRGCRLITTAEPK